ncbi:V-set and immunoglobulin domain-containing protein 4 isoform X2 [Engystomops pustulosus]|uniref:V-set and immunoglobulin domain-containing protein 4 isoform X2 n=1 Tax=Engystomops pustulosus TaxID=76066 RepID=UPI003AFA7D96
MANDRILGHIKWLSVFAICFSGRNAFCDFSLNMKETMTGVRSQSVVIPCKYTAPKDYSEHKVEWSLDSEVIIHRVESEDHIPLTKFRDRVEISKAPDDVSLTMRKLSVIDKGNIKCKVTWKKKDGTLVSNEDITVLKVVREKSETPVDVITTEEPELETMKPTEEPKGKIITATTITQELKQTTKKAKENDITTTAQEQKSETFVDVITTGEPELETMKSTEEPKRNIITTTTQESISETSMDVITTEEPDFITMRPTTEKPQSDIFITTPREHQTKISESDDGSHISTATTETIKSTAIVNFHESTTLISMYTTELFFNNAEIAHNKGWGISFYTLLIIIMCVLCIMTVVIVLIINKKKRKGYTYQLATMNQLLALEDAENRGQSCTNDTRASNNYEPCNPPMMNQLLAKEGAENGCQSCTNDTRASNTYEPCNPPVPVYEGIILNFSNEYESLQIEKNPENSS